MMIRLITYKHKARSIISTTGAKPVLGPNCAISYYDIKMLYGIIQFDPKQA